LKDETREKQMYVSDIASNITSAQKYNDDITTLRSNIEQIFDGKHSTNEYRLILADIQFILNNIRALNDPQNEPNTTLDLYELKEIHDSTNENIEEIGRLHENILVNTLNYELPVLQARLEEILKIERIFRSSNDYITWLDNGAKDYRTLRSTIDVLINIYMDTQHLPIINEALASISNALRKLWSASSSYPSLKSASALLIWASVKSGLIPIATSNKINAASGLFKFESNMLPLFE
jgi:uncharacterized protein with HEPN domain